MARLAIHMLGPFHALLDERPVWGFKTEKDRILLAYLASEDALPCRREAIAEFLWPERPRSSARANLRHTLSILRKVIQDRTEDPSFLIVTRQCLQLNPDADVWTDVAQFHFLLNQGLPPNAKPDRLEEAVCCYYGPFLEGISTSGSPDLEDWILARRAQYHQELMLALNYLATFYEEQKDYGKALPFVFRKVELEPWDESANRQLIRLLALDGQRGAAIDQYKTYRKILKDELGEEPDQETGRLYYSVKSGILDGNSERSTILIESVPAPPSPFIGREKELAEIRFLLENPDCRLISLVGLGGAGKTSLALQAARKHKETFTDGACFVPLAHIRAPANIYSAIASCLNFSFAGNLDHSTQLLTHLAKRKMLLVLDNFEHLLPGGIEVIQQLLHGAPRLVMLLTTTERLNIRAEYICSIDGLPYPAREDNEGGENYSSIALFVHNALRHGVALDSQDIFYVKRICRIVGGMPLAIELAASLLRSLSCEEVAEEIEKDIDVLAVKCLDVPERQQSLRTIFDYSWRLLRMEERIVFSKLSVFRGSFVREAAEEVAGISIDLLTSFIDKSLLRRNAKGRYEMHGLLSRYAFEKLERSGEMEKILTRFLEYYTMFAEEAALALNQKGQVLWLKRLDEEFGNLQAVYQVALSREAAGAELALRLSCGLGRFWLLRGYLQEGKVWLAHAVELGERTPQINNELIVRAISWLGLLYTYIGDYSRAASLAEKGLKLSQQPGSPQCQALLLKVLSDLRRIEGQYEMAKAYSEESLALFQIVADPWGMTLALNNLFRIAYRRNEYRKAAQLAGQSLALSEETGDQWNVALTMIYLGIVSHDQGKYEQGILHLNRSLEISKSLGARVLLAHGTYWSGRLERSRGNPDKALSLFEESLALYHDIGSKWGMAVSLQGLGAVAYDKENYPQAQRLLEDSLQLMVEIGDRQLIASVHLSLGDVEEARGEYQQARKWYKKSLKTLREIKDKWLIARVLSSFARVAVHQKELGKASTLFSAEEAIREVIGTPRSAVEQLAFEKHRKLLMAFQDSVPISINWLGGTDGTSTDMDAIIRYALSDEVYV